MTQKFKIDPRHYKLPVGQGPAGRKRSGATSSVMDFATKAARNTNSNLSKNQVTGLLTGAANRPKQAVMGDGSVAKAAAGSMYYGPTHPWAVCDVDGYNLWPNLYPTFLDWAAMPARPNNRNEINVPIMDFRERLTGYGSEAGSGTTWCDLHTYTAPVTRGCRIKWCFDANRFYWVARQFFTPQDFMDVCFDLPSIQTPDGLNIQDNESFERYMMYARWRNAMLTATMIDDSQVPAGENEAPEDGLAAWFENFPIQHPELTGDCQQLFPVTIDLTNVDGQDLSAFTDIPTAIANRIWQLADRMENLVGNGQRYAFQTNSEGFLVDFALVGNKYDIECLLRAQSCTRLCAGQLNAVFNARDLATPEGRRIWTDDYNQHLYGGTFGDGYLDLPPPLAGAKLSVIRSSTLPQGEGMYLIIKSLPGLEMGFRMWFNDWGPWYRNYISRHPAVAQYVQPVAGSFGSLLYIENMLANGPLCPHGELRGNWKWISYAPWLQTKFENYAECALTPNEFDPLPVNTHATVCPQVIVAPD